jgi:L-iditol 2-dehydrogenase
VRIARSVSRDDVRIEEVADPEPGPDEVVCRIEACGVCGSDVTDWYVDRKLPAVLGHEPAGVVTTLGDAVEGIEVGDRVALHHHVPCGECRRCRRGHETLCERFRATGLDPGGFAEQVRVPPELVSELLPIGELDPVTATFVEPLACVLRSQERAGLKAGDALLVVGAGAMGLLQIAAASARAVQVIWVREPRAERLSLAEAWGAEHHGNELVDVAIVCTPEPAAIAVAAESVAPGGSLCLYAPPRPGTPLAIDGERLFFAEIEVTASYSAGTEDMRAALALLASRRIDPSALVSHRMPLEETGRALSLTRSGEALKAVVLP